MSESCRYPYHHWTVQLYWLGVVFFIGVVVGTITAIRWYEREIVPLKERAAIKSCGKVEL